MYLKDFKSNYYLGFGRRDEPGGEPKYKFHIPLSLFPKVKEGIKRMDRVIKEHQSS